MFHIIEDMFLTVIVPSYKVIKPTIFAKYFSFVIFGLVMLKIVLFCVSALFLSSDPPIIINK